MEARGFPPRFRRWISHLLTTVSSRILVNSQLSEPFSHKRGLRQGDPISPYLFILAADVFQRMTTALSGSLPFQLTPKLPRPIITFQYANDTILFVSAQPPVLRSLLITIHCFGETSGLKVNFSKSSFVPLAVPPHHIPPIHTLLNCPQQSLPIFYLRMPLSFKAPKREDFGMLMQKLEHRLQGWKARFISRAGKLQLVKAVLSAIPAYFMSCFAFPKWLIDRIDSIRRQFLWSRPHTVRPTHLLNWQSVCLPIVNGGLGVLNLRLHNISLLLRWWWRLYTQPPTLWNTYATSIYVVQSPTQGTLILSARGSFFWRSILKIKPIFHSSVQIQLLSGTETSFWQDPWAGQPLLFTVPPPCSRRTISVAAAKPCFLQLIPPLTLQQHEALQTLSVFSPRPGKDVLTWKLSSSGSFIAKSIYMILSEGGKMRSPLSSIWKARVTPSMRLFFFFLLRE